MADSLLPVDKENENPTRLSGKAGAAHPHAGGEHAGRDSDATDVFLPGGSKPRKKMGLGLKLGAPARARRVDFVQEDEDEIPSRPMLLPAPPAVAQPPPPASLAQQPPDAAVAPPSVPKHAWMKDGAPSSISAEYARGPNGVLDAQTWSRRLDEHRRACAQDSAERRLSVLGPLYRKATQDVGQPIDERGGARIWLEYALLRAETSTEDARQIFRHMKHQRIGVQDAAFPVAWSVFEASQGNIDEARKILEKALDQPNFQSNTNGAYPDVRHSRAVIQDALSKLSARSTPPRPIIPAMPSLATPNSDDSGDSGDLVLVRERNAAEHDAQGLAYASLPVGAAKAAPTAPKVAPYVCDANADTIVMERIQMPPPVAAASTENGTQLLARAPMPATPAVPATSQLEVHAPEAPLIASSAANARTTTELADADDTVRRPELQYPYLLPIEEGSERSPSDASSQGSVTNTLCHDTVRVQALQLPAPFTGSCAPLSTPQPASMASSYGSSATPAPADPPSTPAVSCAAPATPARTGAAAAADAPASATATRQHGLRFASTPGHAPTAVTLAAGRAAPLSTVASRESLLTGHAEVSVNGVPYKVLELLGKGGTSQVFKVLSPLNEVLALKKVALEADSEEANGLAEAVQNEIDLMMRFKSVPEATRCIIELVDAEVNLTERVVYMVMECGEIDFKGILQRDQEERQAKGLELNETFVCGYWEQMLSAVDVMHKARVIHGDLKPMNFLCVKGALKLIDFGIAKSMTNDNPDVTKIERENTVGTLNYMSPETIVGQDAQDEHGKSVFTQGRASDVWSLGCILYQMVYGAPPFAHVKNYLRKMQAITDERVEIQFPPLRTSKFPYLLEVMKACLQRKPECRPKLSELLQHPLLRGPIAPSAAPAGGLSISQLEALIRQAAASGSTEISTEAILKAAIATPTAALPVTSATPGARTQAAPLPVTAPVSAGPSPATSPPPASLPGPPPQHQPGSQAAAALPSTPRAAPSTPRAPSSNSKVLPSPLPRRELRLPAPPTMLSAPPPAPPPVVVAPPPVFAAPPAPPLAPLAAPRSAPAAPTAARPQAAAAEPSHQAWSTADLQSAQKNLKKAAPREGKDAAPREVRASVPELMLQKAQSLRGAYGSDDTVDLSREDDTFGI